MSAGETFVLPPGAELISASDSGAITSSCSTPIPTVPTKCWQIMWVLNLDSEGGKTVRAIVAVPPIAVGLGNALIDIPNTGNAWEVGDDDTADITIENISIGGNVVSSSVSCTDFTNIENTIAGSSSGALLSDRKYNMFTKKQSLTFSENEMWGDWWESGYKVYTFSFKATEEIAKTVYLEFATTLDPTNIGSIPRYFAKELDCDNYPTTSLVTTC